MFGHRWFAATAGAAVAVSFLAPGIPAARGDGADRDVLVAELTRLYELGESVRLRAKAQRQFEKLRHLAPANAEVLYAYALINLQQHSYSDAARLLDQVVRLQADNLTARQMVAWLSVLRREHDRAWTDMEQLAEALPPESTDELEELPHLETARFLGQLVGYIEKLDEHVGSRIFREAAAKRIAVKLGSRRRTAFDEGRAAVGEKFAAQAEATERLREEAMEKARQQRDRVLSELEKQRQEVIARLQPLEAQRGQLLAKRQSELESLDAERRELDAAARGLKSQHAGLVREIRDIEETIWELEALADEPDIEPIEEIRLLDEADAWRRVLSRRRAELNRVAARLTTLGAQAENLRKRQEEVENRYAGALREIERLKRRRTSLESEMTLLSGKRISGNTSGVRSRKKQTLALTHYVPMPVQPETEKQAILDRLR
jgi:prefoldin subunit 5